MKTLCAVLLLVFGLTAATCATGCSQAQVQTVEADFHSAASKALGLVTIALDDPTFLAEAKTVVADAVAKAAPADATEANALLADVNAGSLASAQGRLKKLVKATSASGASTAPVTSK